MVDGKVDVICFHEVEGDGVETVRGKRKAFGKSTELNRTRNIRRHYWSSLKLKCDLTLRTYSGQIHIM